MLEQREAFVTSVKPRQSSVSRRVINATVTTSPKTIYLGRHNNMIIIAYDDDLLLCDQTFDVVNVNQQRFVDAGTALTMRDDREEYITLAAAAASTRVRIIIW